MSGSDGATIPLPFVVPGDWSAKPLRLACKLIADGDWVELKDQGGQDFRLLQISNIGIGDFIETGKYRCITAETFHRLRCTEINVGDVLVARMPEPTGRCWYVKTLPWRAIAAVDVAIVRTNESELDARFLSYYLNSPQSLAAVASLTTGTTRLRIRRADIGRLTVPLPPLAEQGAIAEALGALDDKIEANRRTTSAILSLTAALWIEAFAEPSPDWPLETVEEIATVVGGSTPSTKVEEYWDGDIGWATPRDMSRLSLPVLLSTDRRITELGLGQISSGLLPVGTLLLSSRAPIGYLAIGELPVAINQGIIAVVPGGRLPVLYLWQWLLYNMDSVKERANGTTFLEISKSNFRSMLIPLPPMSLVEGWMEFARALYGLLVSMERETQALIALRDTLLPKLMSGELRVRDAEHLVEDVA